MAVRKTPHTPAKRAGKPRPPSAGQAPPADSEGKASKRARKTSVAAARADAPVDPAAVRAALEAAGILLPPPRFDEPPMSPTELEQLEQEVDAWLYTLPEPLGLSEAVIEDRGSW